jgi:hypothetical protein
VTTSHRFADDGCLHVSYVGTLLPAGFDTLRALFSALAAERAGGAGAQRLRLHFFGTSNLRSADAPHRVLPIAAEYGLGEVVTEHAPRLDYFDALAFDRRTPSCSWAAANDITRRARFSQRSSPSGRCS